MKTNKFTRKFLGKLNNFESREEQQLEKKHLKAYIKGHTRFSHGYKDILNKLGELVGREPRWHTVKQQVTELK